MLGGAWMAGALHAIADATRWYPRHATALIGTSAGSVLAVLGAAGVPPWLLIPESSANIYHGQVTASGDLEINSDLWERIVRRNRMGLPRLRPGSLSLALASIRTGRPALLKVLSGIAPTGFISTDPIKETVSWVAPAGSWVHHPSCWVVACDYATGARVVFGRDGAPRAGVGQAVAASCAIPGYYRPEPIDGRLYVDGGLHSFSNADLLLGAGLDLVLILSPTSTRQRFRGWDPLHRFTDATRRAVAQQLDAEVEALRRDGKQVLVLEPGAEDLVAIGGNLMNDRRRGIVMRTALRTTAAQLGSREARQALRSLEPPERLRVAI